MNKVWCFLLHVLPKGFTRIRSYGFLTNRGKTGALAKIRACLGAPAPSPLEDPSDGEAAPGPRVCSSGGGTLVPLVVFP